MNVCPKTSSFAGVNGFGDFVLSIVTAEAFNSATGAWAAEYGRHRAVGENLTPWDAGTEPNRE